MSTKIGFIGTGVMGGALARAVSKTEKDIMLSNVPESTAKALASEIGGIVGTNLKVAENCEYIVLAVKPQVIFSVIAEIAPVLKNRKDNKDNFVLITIAAGVSIDSIKQAVGIDFPVIRLMPNTPVSVGKGVILSAFSDVNETQKAEFFSLFSAAGFCDEIAESKIDAAGALTGCGPAFAYIAMQSLADGAVACGIDRQTATKYAEMTVLGAAQLAIDSGEHLEKLKDAVCSPAGSTIEGVNVLENRSVRAAFADAVKASYKRSLELGRLK
ncbi:MAG: pyrroline-5-carboxylate reductase [Clostridia bacterium]|nr:pyrroline-5-carboxylate reductase [Clostridia bacterium]